MITNFFRIDIPFTNFQIQRVPYSDGVWHNLKKTYNKCASFFRHEGYIYCSPQLGEELNIGELVTLNINKSSNVVLSLIRHLIFRTFRDKFHDRIPLGFSPLRFYSSKSEHDYALALLPNELKRKICFSRVIEVESRKIVENDEVVFGILIGSHQRWQFNIKANELHEEGYNLIGKSVIETHEIPGLEGVLAPEIELLGEIQKISGSKAIINTNNGLIERELGSLFLQKTKSQIGDYLNFRIGEKQTISFFSNLENLHHQNTSINKVMVEILRFARWFSKEKGAYRIYQNNDGFCFNVTMDNHFDITSIPIQTTNLVFDYGPGASASKPLTGLSKYGPFNAERFEKNNLNILALCKPSSRGAMSEFLQRLISGMPESRAYKRGLVNLFRLTSAKPVIEEICNGTIDAYKDAIDKAIRTSEMSFDIALIECEDKSKSIPVEINPYYNARSRLMTYGIPTQGIKTSHLRLPANKQEWILCPLALQIYAKVGGTPWRLPSAQGVDKEIIVGVGNALERKNLWSGAEQSRIVGITTFFLGDGSYMLGERLKSVPYDSYFEELLESLKSSLTKISKEYGWQKGDTIRLVFHVFKPIKNIEADVVEELVSLFDRYKIKYSFVTISTTHPWVMHRDFNGRNVVLSERGDNIILDSHSCLLQLRGDKDRPNRRQRPPRPVLVRIHEKSTYTDLQYIVQQIHDFSYLSWRSFYPNEIPVTVFYSNLIATESKNLNKLSDWRHEFLDQHFKRKQWFL